jgi:transposase
MPELGAIAHKCLASLAGLAPIARDSGQRSGKRVIRGGRGPLRQALYLPALVAVRFDAATKARYNALLAAGKPPKVALIAIMRLPDRSAPARGAARRRRRCDRAADGDRH